jgi:hypothetical protein
MHSKGSNFQVEEFATCTAMTSSRKNPVLDFSCVGGMAAMEGLPKLNPAAEKLVRLRDVQRLSPSASCDWWTPMHATTVVAFRLHMIGHTAGAHAQQCHSTHAPHQ